MLKQLLLAGLILIGAPTFASHMKGGEITWEKSTNGQFIFELRLYRDCSSGGPALPPTRVISGPNGNINLSSDTAYSINPTCTGTGQIVCNVLGTGGTEVYVYRSSPITLPGTPPTTGWKFSYSDCCRGTNGVNLSNSGSTAFYVESVMYPGPASSSPKFATHPNQILTGYTKTYHAGAVSPNPGDSLHHVLVSVRTGASTTATYVSGYSATSPFPNSASHPSNGAISIDGNTGLVSYDIQSATNGTYVFAVAVEQWHNGVKVGMIYRDYMVSYMNGAASNSSPVAAIDTAQFKNISKTSSRTYEVVASPGDTLEFIVSASDFDNNASNMLPQVISFDAKGRSLDVSYTAAGIANGAKLSPVAPQNGFSQSVNNNIQFSWPITAAHVQDPYHFFTFSFKDDECPVPGISNITLKVILQAAASISADSLTVCAGDSVQLQGFTNNATYQWSPAAGLSDPSVKNPMASPATSGYYYLSNGAGNMDSVYVQVTPPGTTDLAFANGKLELTDTNATTNRIWYYNGIPFFYPHDTLTPIGFGNYWVKAQQGACTLFSDTFNINTGHSFSVFDPTNGGYNGTNLPLPGSLGATFSINQSAAINSVTIVGLEDLHKSGAGYDLNLKVYDANQMEVFSKDVTLTPPFYGPLNVEVGYAIQANADYTIAVSGDSAFAFKLYENVSYPATPHFNGITVKGSFEGAHGQFPVQPSNYLLPFSINTDMQVVGLEEPAGGVLRIYPNPAKEEFTLSGLVGNTTIKILDTHGKLIRELTSSSPYEKINLRNAPDGLYLITIYSANNVTIKRLILR